MELSFKTTVQASKERIWPYYVDISRRKIWEKDLEYLTFDETPKTGTTGKMKLQNMPEMNFTLVHFVENESYCDCTVVPGMGSVYFSHDILLEDGTVYIKHAVRLEAEQPSPRDLEVLRGIFADVPDNVMFIKQEVEK